MEKEIKPSIYYENLLELSNFDDKVVSKIFVKKFNGFSHVRNYHRPISKVLSLKLWKDHKISI